MTFDLTSGGGAATSDSGEGVHSDDKAHESLVFNSHALVHNALVDVHVYACVHVLYMYVHNVHVYM